MPIKQLTALELKQAIAENSNVLLLDVREPSEYQFAHIGGSLSIPLKQLPGKLTELDSEKEIVAICHHGMRSMQAANFLANNGFRQIANLKGGIDAWSLDCDSSIRRY